MSSAITTLDEAKTTLSRLAATVNSSSRLTRAERIETLGRIYAIRLTQEDRAKLLEHIIAQRKIEGANRAYLLRDDNQFLLPIRYVFPGLKDRTNVSRYAGALKELRRRSVECSQFEQEVRKNGGLVELYWLSRLRSGKKQTRSKINLDRNITVDSGRELSLRLMPTAGGIFKVLECSQAA